VQYFRGPGKPRAVGSSFSTFTSAHPQSHSGGGFSSNPKYDKDKVALAKAKAKHRELHDKRITQENAFLASMRDKYAFTSKYGVEPPKNFPLSPWKRGRVPPAALEHPQWDHRFAISEGAEGRLSKAGWPVIQNSFEADPPRVPHKRNPAFDDPELW
jgi:hypothetical protein